MSREFEIFISFKATDGGVPTEDIKIAEDLYTSLTNMGFLTFFSAKTLKEGGCAEFSKEIDAALDQAKLLIVVATKLRYVNSGWLEHEWRSFHDDILSNVKDNAQIITYTGGINPTELPRVLRYVQNYSHIEKKELLAFVQSFFNSETVSRTLPVVNESTSHVTKHISDSEHSIYNSASSGELEILRLRGRRSYAIDMQAIDYIKSQMNRKKYNVLVIGCAYGYVTETRFGLDDDIENVICIDKNEDTLTCAREMYRDYPHMKFYNVEIQSEDYVDKIKSIMKELDIDYIDIVFASDIFRYMSNVGIVIRKTRELIRPDGFMLVRDCDDSLKAATPDPQSILGCVCAASQNLKGMPDYYIGRKLPMVLQRGGFSIREVKIDINSTLNMSYSEKEEFFLSTFISRKNIAKQVLECDSSLKSQVDDLLSSIDRLEDLFYGLEFWYSESNILFIAQKD